ncbi:putative quinol monooxygenase [Mycoplasmopsis lipofaciens]|uniref:putative quinol monooxygenase n=1 Tax=Mycoplasmopsis lipofaciens TaxID=114884 RepID=UPI00048618B8|nr:hypothetical protein [Mycoplasmopsis lipofaciens]
MIYIITKTFKIKNDLKNDFITEIRNFIYTTKKEELNLSIDGAWKNESIFLLIERWSSKESYNSFLNDKENKKLINEIKSKYVIQERTTESTTII